MAVHTLVGGRVLHGVHEEGTCYGEFCCIHRPSDHSMVAWDQRFVGGAMFRVSPEGDAYPDPDGFQKNSKPNAVRCSSCDEMIVSIHRHDYITCSCGDVSVDGGFDYNKRSFREGAKWVEITEWPIRLPAEA